MCHLRENVYGMCKRGIGGASVGRFLERVENVGLVHGVVELDETGREWRYSCLKRVWLSCDRPEDQVERLVPGL